MSDPKNDGQSGVEYTELWEPEPMVRWYDPGQLLKTGVRVATSSLFAENADSRLLQPLLEVTLAADEGAGGKYEFCDDREIVVDYVADPGDGFHSTYAIARLTTLAIEAGAERIPPSKVLVLGGDQVYPTASYEAYDRRLVKPYELASNALPWTERRYLFAIPGNHDWYDNLVSFTRIFIQGTQLGKWRLPQRRSYFALRLPHDWWLLGTDVQLGSDIDDFQESFFLDLAASFPKSANIILCHAEPHWVFEHETLTTGNRTPPRAMRIARVERALDGDCQRVRAIIAGDLHHYRRHVATLPSLPGRLTPLITAGGGGAFLHPTHGWRDGSDPKRKERDASLPAGLPRYECKLAYPSPEASRSMARHAWWGLLRKNPWFAAASGAVYGIVALNLLLAARNACLDVTCTGAIWAGILNPATLTWFILIVAAFVMSTDTSSKTYRWVAGIIHGLTHACFAIAIPALIVHFGDRWAVGRSFTHETGDQLVALGGFVLALLTSILAGGVVGGLLMGTYLAVSLNVFGRHRNETFSALGIEGFKNFLRMRIDDRGRLTIFAFGLERVPTAWSPAPLAALRSGQSPVPVGDGVDPHLIEVIPIERNPASPPPAPKA